MNKPSEQTDLDVPKGNKISILEKKEKESIEVFLDSLIEINHSNFEDININKENDKNQFTLNSVLKKLFDDDKNFYKNLYLGIFELNNLKWFNIQENDFNNDDIENNKEEGKDVFNQNPCGNKNKLIAISKELNLNMKKSNTYFDVFFRKIKFVGDIIIYNIILYDISELINTKKIYEEEIKTKEKIFSKIENEFYFPINKIISSVSEVRKKFPVKNNSEIEKDEIYNFNVVEEIFDKNSFLDCFKPKKNNNDLNKLQLGNEKNCGKCQHNNINNFMIFNSEINFHVEKIKYLSEYLIFLFNNILLITKGGNHFNNNCKIEWEKISINKLIGDCFQILKILLSSNKEKIKNIKPEVIFDENSPYDERIDFNKLFIFSDSLKLKQLILNLISNSIKFTKKGNIAIICQIKEESFNGILRSCLTITIKDTGLGLNSIDKRKLLLFLNTNEYSSESNYSIGHFKDCFNRGIGLFIIKNIAKKLNFKIRFKSEIGIGSEFLLVIPIDLNKMNFYRDKNIEILSNVNTNFVSLFFYII